MNLVLNHFLIVNLKLNQKKNLRIIKSSALGLRFYYKELEVVLYNIVAYLLFVVEKINFFLKIFIALL